MNKEQFKQLYEQNYTYDEPIPFITSKAKKEREKLQLEISRLNKIEFLSEDDSILLEQYKKEYENQVLKIYPVMMQDYFDFYSAIGVLSIEKEKIPDEKVLSMSYLDFIFYLIQTDANGEIYASMLVKILKLCLRLELDGVRYLEKDGRFKIILNDIEIGKKDFDILRKIICYQNMPDFDDTYIDPELEQALKEVEELKSKGSGSTSLEDQIVCVSISTPYKIDDIKKMSIRKFVKTLKKVDVKLHYEIYKNGEMAGATFKEGIVHWMYDKDSKFDSLTSYGSFKDKMGSVT